MGYNTCTEFNASADEMRYSMLSIPFVAVDGKNLSLNDLVFASPTKNNQKARADQIKLWVWKDAKNTYDYETWFIKTDGKWYNFDTPTLGFDDPSAHPDGLPPGTTFWYNSQKRATAGSLTSSGAVLDEDFVFTVIRPEPTYSFVGYPFPTALKLNDKTQVDWGAAVANNQKARADQIKLWVKQESGGYDYVTYYLSTSGWKAWNSPNNLFEVDFPNGLPVGTGFWYNAQKKTGSTEFDVTFKSPIAKSAE